MPPLVIDIRSAEDSRDVVHRAVQALAEGKLVVLPTETVYGLAASALNAGAIERLMQAKNRGANHPLSLAVKSADDALDYVPNLSALGRRLARRCWPGPVTLVVQDHHPQSLIRQLPASVQAAVAPDDVVGLRAPAHQTALDVLRMLVGPVALTSANLTGQPEAVTAEEVIEQLGDHVQLILNDGRSRLAQPSTVVRVRDNDLQILRPGVVSEQALKRLTGFIILLVCTGNTCRSPMAEAICRGLLAKRLGCTPQDLGERGIYVLSAGLSASMGSRAAAEAIEVVGEMGLALGDHESQPITPQLVRQADIIWTMTAGHRQAIVREWPDAAQRTSLLARDQRDIADPIGLPLEYYKRCAQEIKRELELRIAELEIL